MAMKNILLSSFLVVLQAWTVIGIMGGEPAQPGEFKNVVALQVLIIEYYETFCGGFIASKLWVMTTGRCILLIDGLSAPFQMVRVVAGTINVQGQDPNGQYLKIKLYVKHKDFEDSSNIYQSDFGLLKVERNGFVENEHVAIYPITRMIDDPTVFGRTIVKIAGWGALNNEDAIRGNYSDTLQALTVEIISRVTCRRLLKAAFMRDGLELFDDGLIYKSHLCSGPLTEGQSMCIGDAGGPLMRTLDSGGLEVLGIMSMKFGKCGRANTPSIHSHLGKIRPWVNKIRKIYGEPDIDLYPI